MSEIVEEQYVTKTSIDVSQIYSFFELLVNMEMGDFYQTNYYVDKLKIDTDPEIPDMIPVINNCYVELTNECSLKCAYCSYPKLTACLACRKMNGSINMGSLTKFLDRIFNMKLKSLTFHGGDPLVNKTLVTDLIEFCREHSFKGQINLITNGTLIDEQIVKVFSKYNVHPVLPVILNQNLRLNAKFKRKIISVARLAHEAKVSFSITLLDSGNEDYLREEFKFAQLLEPRKINRAILLHGKGKITDKTHLSSEPLLDITEHVNPQVYQNNGKHHPCLFGRIAVSANGEILPCPHMNSNILGNINSTDSINTIFEESLIDKFWDLSLPKIKMCQECEFAFGCYDCRAAELEFTEDLCEKNICSLDRNKLKVIR